MVELDKKEEPIIILKDNDEDEVEIEEGETFIREFKIKTNQKLSLGEMAYLFD